MPGTQLKRLKLNPSTHLSGHATRRGTAFLKVLLDNFYHFAAASSKEKRF
jgi:hypothetical protein